MFYLNGILVPNAGTSLAAPIWASIVTLINEKRSENGKNPVGFINPVLYVILFEKNRNEDHADVLPQHIDIRIRKSSTTLQMAPTQGALLTASQLWRDGTR